MTFKNYFQYAYGETVMVFFILYKSEDEHFVVVYMAHPSCIGIKEGKTTKVLQI